VFTQAVARVKAARTPQECRDGGSRVPQALNALPPEVANAVAAPTAAPIAGDKPPAPVNCSLDDRNERQFSRKTNGKRSRHFVIFRLCCSIQRAGGERLTAGQGSFR